MPHFHTLIAGSGIMGLSCAYEEAKRGKKVFLFDRYSFSSKASWASAGILTNRDAKIFHSTFREFQIKSQELFPNWLAEVSGFSKKNIKLEQHGAYQLFDTSIPGQKEGLEQELGKLNREGAKNFTHSNSPPEWLTPFLKNKNPEVLFFPEEAYVSNRNLLTALSEANLHLGVKMKNNTQVVSLLSTSKGIHLKYNSLETQNRAESPTLTEITADQLVITAGAWSGDLLKFFGYAPPLVPVRGQAFTIANPFPTSSFIHYGKELYMVPRGNQLLVGVTTEPRISEEEFTPEGEKGIRALIAQGFGELSEQPALEKWAGIRPRTRDRQPLMGFVNEEKNVSICAGHYKSGIGMAPLSARWMSCLINGENLPLQTPEFNPHRKKGLKVLN